MYLLNGTPAVSLRRTEMGALDFLSLRERDFLRRHRLWGLKWRFGDGIAVGKENSRQN